MIPGIKSFIKKEAVLCIAALCAVATMVLVPPDEKYLNYIDWRVLGILLSLMIWANSTKLNNLGICYKT